MASENVDTQQVMVFGLDGSRDSYDALEWTLDHFFVPCAPKYHFNLILVYAKPIPYCAPAFVSGRAMGSAGETMRHRDAEHEQAAARVSERAEEICSSKSVFGVPPVDIIAGEPKYVFCDAVKKHHGSMLVLGSHDDCFLTRIFGCSVSDYCAHHAPCCTVMIVKNPKTKQ